MKKTAFLILMGSALLMTNRVVAQLHNLDTGWHHLRNTGPREWSDFPAEVPLQKLTLKFKSHAPAGEQCLSLRQYDVKLNWRVLLNGKLIGSLVEDEKDLVCYLPVPEGLLHPDNTLEILCEATQGDDIRLGQLVLHQRPLKNVLSDGEVSVEVADAESGATIPARITITNEEGTLQTFIGSADQPLAVRPGYVYTGNGKASLALPAGTYKLYAARGFEYGVDSVRVVVSKGARKHHRFAIRREVPTNGWASSDTHIHTFTWSRHGDASDAERVLTIAGEGLELPIITDHNLQIDVRSLAANQGVAEYFTPVTGNEVTTSVGHFNIFPLAAGQPVFDFKLKNWKALSVNFGDAASTKAIILNHARDIHAGFRPFDPKIHLSSAGMRLDGGEVPANAMEIINSGAQQTDLLELTRDWFGLLNHGRIVTPVGSSDSHDVSRYIVGQARTYIRCNDEDPARIDVAEAVRNFRDGNVMVSFGLLAEIEINDSYGPGELAPASDEIKVSVKVKGPAWIRADRVSLYANGKKIHEERINDQTAAGIKWDGTWNITTPTHDVFLVAIAEGPDGRAPFWPIARPYQPTSPSWKGGVMGLSGAVWIDADKNGKRDSARGYAQSLYRQAGGDINVLIQSLASYDQAVAIQVAALLHMDGKNLEAPEITAALSRAAPETKSGFETVRQELDLGK